MSKFAPITVTDDPRLVVETIGGREYKFWLCPRAHRIARILHGYDPQNMSQEEIEQIDNIEGVLRTLWVAHLPFEPDLSFDDFEVRFLVQEFDALAEAMRKIAERQLAPVAGGEEEAEPKKKGRRSA